MGHKRLLLGTQAQAQVSVADHIVWIPLDPSLLHFRVFLSQLRFALMACTYGSLLKFLRLPGLRGLGFCVPGVAFNQWVWECGRHSSFAG